MRYHIQHFKRQETEQVLRTFGEMMKHWQLTFGAILIQAQKIPGSLNRILKNNGYTTNNRNATPDLAHQAAPVVEAPEPVVPGDEHVSGGDKFPSLPLTGEISWRCFKGYQKYF